MQMVNSDADATSYAYGPSIILNNGVYHVFFCSAGSYPTWDSIRYVQSTDGKNWSLPVIVLRATGANGFDLAACDPSVVFFQGFYYMYYSSAYTTAPNLFQTVIQVARSGNIGGPYLTYTQRGTWEDTPTDPKIIIKPLVTRDQDPVGYGAGPQSVVVHNGEILLWYTDDSIDLDSGRIYLLRSTDPVRWIPSPYSFGGRKTGWVMPSLASLAASGHCSPEHRVGWAIVARGIAGLAYGGLLLGAYRIIGGWLSRESHGLAIGLVLAMTQLMAPLTPLIIAPGATHVGWRWSSRVVAALWFVWLPIWIWLSRRSGDAMRRESHRYPVTLAQMFKDPVTWALVVGVSLTTPLLFFRSGQLLNQASELLKSDRSNARWFFVLVLLPAVGAVAAGILSDSLIRKGWSAGKSRTAIATICGLLTSLPTVFAFSRSPVIYLLFAMLSVTAGQGLFAVLYTVLVDAVPGRGIILGAALGGWLSGLMSNVANMMIESISSRSGSGPLLIGFSVLTLIATLMCSLADKKDASGADPVVDRL